MFTIGQRPAPASASSVLFVVREGFKLGAKRSDGTLIFHTGRVSVNVWPAQTASEDA